MTARSDDRAHLLQTFARSEQASEVDLGGETSSVMLQHEAQIPQPVKKRISAGNMSHSVLGSFAIFYLSC